MKNIILGVTVFLFCNTICAQYQFQSGQYGTSGFKPLMGQTTIKLSTSSNTNSGFNNSLLTTTSAPPTLSFPILDNGDLWKESLKMSMRTRTLISAGLFISTGATGYLMRGSNGDPNDALLTIHKLSSVSNLVLLDATAWKKHKSTSLSWLETVAAVTMNVSFIATITTGGMQSMDRTNPGWVNTSHQITPWITALASGALLYLLNR